MERKHYPGELTDKEWELVKPIVERNGSPRGRKSKYGKRAMINAIFYLIRSGCSWRLLPKDFPPWQAVYSQFARWKNGKVFEEMHDHVRSTLRVLLNRAVKPSAGIIDSQSVKTTEKGGSVDMMPVRRLKGVRGTSRLTRKGFYYRHMLPLRKRAIKRDASGC